MSDLNKMMREREDAKSEGQIILNKLKETEYQIRVAKVEGNESRLSTLNAELTVLTEMSSEIIKRIDELNPLIEEQQKTLTKEANDLFAYSQVSLGCSLLAIFMPSGFKLGWFAICLIIAAILYYKHNDRKAYSSGISKDELDEIKKTASENAERDHRNREELAKAIAREIKK